MNNKIIPRFRRRVDKDLYVPIEILHWKPDRSLCRFEDGKEKYVNNRQISIDPECYPVDKIVVIYGGRARARIVRVGRNKVLIQFVHWISHAKGHWCLYQDWVPIHAIDRFSADQTWPPNEAPSEVHRPDMQGMQRNGPGKPRALHLRPTELQQGYHRTLPREETSAMNSEELIILKKTLDSTMLNDRQKETIHKIVNGDFPEVEARLKIQRILDEVCALADTLREQLSDERIAHARTMEAWREENGKR